METRLILRGGERGKEPPVVGEGEVMKASGMKELIGKRLSSLNPKRKQSFPFSEESWNEP